MEPDLTAGAPGAFAPLTDINELALELLARRAAGEPAGLPPMLREPRDLWCALTATQRRRLAGCPFLLVDPGLGREDGAPHRALDGVQDLAGDEWWAGDESLARLAYLTLTYAWHLARTRPLAARVVLGLPNDCCAWLAELGLRELGECAERSPRRLRPRWPDSPAVWRHLLSAAASTDPAEFELARLRGMQLLAARHWPADPGRPRVRPRSG